MNLLCQQRGQKWAYPFAARVFVFVAQQMPPPGGIKCCPIDGGPEDVGEASNNVPHWLIVYHVANQKLCVLMALCFAGRVYVPSAFTCN